MRKTAATLALALLVARSAPADDAWELPGVGDDTSANTTNILRHGIVQGQHDLEGAPPNRDHDWMRLAVKPRHSYEAQVSGGLWREGAGLTLPTFDRVDASGAVLTAGVASSEDVEGFDNSRGRTVRWIESAGGQALLRASGDSAAATLPTAYEVVFHDTTLFVPRWNNTATQTTVLVLQNATNTTVTGSVYFHSGAGALLATVPVNVPQHGVQLLATSAVPALAGQSGAAQIAQLGGYGALTGKAVALETATGFTFDTAITPLPR